jgi:hypothetical protein
MDELKPAWNKIIPGAQRFIDALDGSAILDKETGLVWAKSLDATQRTWLEASDYCTTLTLGGRLGWRLPTIEELASLIDPSVAGSPKLPTGHSFQNVLNGIYWSSRNYSGNNENAWSVNMDTGAVNNKIKSNGYFVWPVRSGE